MSATAFQSSCDVSPQFLRNIPFLADPSSLLLWTCDARGLVEFVCASWLAFSGRTLEQEIGCGWFDLVHEGDLPGLKNGLEQALQAQQPFRLMYRLQRSDGMYRWMLNQGKVRISPAGEFAGYVGQCFDVTAYRQAGTVDDGLALAPQRLLELLQQTRLIAVVMDQQGRVIFSNGSLCRLLGLEDTVLIDVPLFSRYLAPTDTALLNTIHPDGSARAHFPAEFESELLTGRGDTCHVLWHAIALPNYEAHGDSAILIGDDITQSHRLEEELKLTSRVFESSSQAMAITTVDLNIISINQAFTQCTGYTKEDAVGQTPRLLKSGRQDQPFYEQMWKSINETGHWRGDIWDRHKSGSVYPEFLSISAIKDDSGKVTNYAAIFYDITERKAFEEHLDFLAHYDALTGLPNRALLHDRLQQSLDRAKRQGTKIGLLYLDLNGFKQINDTWGHGVGDSLLQAVAQRLKDCVRGSDTVARMGGDEFVVLVPDVKAVDTIAHVAGKIMTTLIAPYDLDGHAVVSAPSIGISVYPDDQADVEVLLQHADAAMYDAKRNRDGSYRFFHDLNG